jgi:hypothetical protein
VHHVDQGEGKCPPAVVDIHGSDMNLRAKDAMTDLSSVPIASTIPELFGRGGTGGFGRARRKGGAHENTM